MSPEALLSVGVPAANAPAVSSSPGPTSGGGATVAGPTGTQGSGKAGSGENMSGAPSGSGAANPQQSAQAPNAQQRQGSSPQNGSPSKSASTPPRARNGSQTKHGAPAGKNFSQALAQSLAAPAKPMTAVLTGKPTTPVAQPVDKAHKSDPVSAAMALMGQAVPNTAIAAQSVTTGKTAASVVAPTGGASGVTPAAPAAESAAHKLAQTKALTQIPGSDAHSAPASGGQSASNAQLVSAGQLAAGVHSAPRPAAAPTATLSAPVGSSGWNEQLGTQLTWMVSKGVQNASLQMAPQHLGPVQVSISVHHGQASVWFGAAQPETRQALSQALPQLRAMFASQGLALTDSGVSQDAPRDSRRAARPAVNGVGEVSAADGTAVTVSGGLAGSGLIDTYA